VGGVRGRREGQEKNQCSGGGRFLSRVSDTGDPKTAKGFSGGGKYVDKGAYKKEKQGQKNKLGGAGGVRGGAITVTAGIRNTQRLVKSKDRGSQYQLGDPSRKGGETPGRTHRQRHAVEELLKAYKKNSRRAGDKGVLQPEIHLYRPDDGLKIRGDGVRAARQGVSGGWLGRMIALGRLSSRKEIWNATRKDIKPRKMKSRAGEEVDELKKSAPL